MTNTSASVSFEDEWGHESIALFISDNGQKLVDSAIAFCNNIRKLDKISRDLSSPRVMFLFSMWLANPPYIEELKDDEEKNEQYYFGMDGEDGDNSGLGHHIINIPTCREVSYHDRI